MDYRYLARQHVVYAAAVMTDRRWDCSLNLIKEVQALRIAKLCVRPIIRMASDVYQVQKFAN